MPKTPGDEIKLYSRSRIQQGLLWIGVEKEGHKYFSLNGNMLNYTGQIKDPKQFIDKCAVAVTHTNYFTDETGFKKVTDVCWVNVECRNIYFLCEVQVSLHLYHHDDHRYF